MLIASIIKIDNDPFAHVVVINKGKKHGVYVGQPVIDGSGLMGNVVDVTNFILHEMGQPLHAFDLDQLAGKKIIIKSISEELNFTTLDSKKRKLPAGTLMICDGNREVAIAGVMGGENSEVSTSTKNFN